MAGGGKGSEYVTVSYVMCAGAFLALTLFTLWRIMEPLPKIQKHDLRFRIYWCVKCTVYVMSMSFWLSMLHLTNFETLMLDALGFAEDEIIKPLEFILTCPAMMLIVVVLAGDTVPSRRQIEIMSLTFWVLVFGFAAVQVTVLVAKMMFYITGCVIFMVLLERINLCVKEHSGGKESLLRPTGFSGSIYRKFCLKTVITWALFPMWFILSPQGLSVVSDYDTAAMISAGLNIFSKGFFALYVVHIYEAYVGAETLMEHPHHEGQEFQAAAEAAARLGTAGALASMQTKIDKDLDRIDKIKRSLETGPPWMRQLSDASAGHHELAESLSTGRKDRSGTSTPNTLRLPHMQNAQSTFARGGFRHSHSSLADSTPDFHGGGLGMSQPQQQQQGMHGNAQALQQRPATSRAQDLPYAPPPSYGLQQTHERAGLCQAMAQPQDQGMQPLPAAGPALDGRSGAIPVQVPSLPLDTLQAHGGSHQFHAAAYHESAAPRVLGSPADDGWSSPSSARSADGPSVCNVMPKMGDPPDVLEGPAHHDPMALGLPEDSGHATPVMFRHDPAAGGDFPAHPRAASSTAAPLPPAGVGCGHRSGGPLTGAAGSAWRRLRPPDGGGLAAATSETPHQAAAAHLSPV